MEGIGLELVTGEFGVAVLEHVDEEVHGAGEALEQTERPVRLPMGSVIVQTELGETHGTVKVHGLLRQSVEGQEGVGIASCTVTQSVALVEKATPPHTLATVHSSPSQLLIAIRL